MKREVGNELPSLASTFQDDLYGCSLASSTSASSQSVWSDASSQSSEDSSYTNDTDDSCQSAAANSASKFEKTWPSQPVPAPPAAVPATLRQNPRRTSAGSISRPRCPPALVRQCDRKLSFVDNLVDCATQIVEAVWPLSSILCRSEMGDKAVLPLRTFIQETLRRSRTSYSTLQVALYYMILIKPHVPKHDFTMEQSDDSPSCRALQCGRRMFLAALILASKYLQDRNYSARAWSKISGLNTLEINQNEIAFLNAVRWKLHITDEIFQRWTEIVLKHTPPSPPSSPDMACLTVYNKQCAEWKEIILELSPDLDNIERLFPSAFLPKKLQESRTSSPRIIVRSPSGPVHELSPTPKPAELITPIVMEPMPVSVHTPGRLAPALGLLPTPRLTPQMAGYNTPAVSAVSHLMGKSGAMGMAMAQSSNLCASQLLDRLSSSTASSPLAYFANRRSSLATTVSTASSPESMVSDSSRISRSSSISSACSVISAVPHKLAAPARYRLAKLSCERSSLLTTVASVPEDYAMCLTSSPETYTGPVGKLDEMSMENSEARRAMELDEVARDADAARALQELHHYHYSAETTRTSRSTLKRSRTCSNDNSLLQDHVREMLGNANTPAKDAAWPDTLVRSRSNVCEAGRLAVRPCNIRPRKRVCCSTEAAQSLAAPLRSMHHGLHGPGMWEGILN